MVAQRQHNSRHASSPAHRDAPGARQMRVKALVGTLALTCSARSRIVEMIVVAESADAAHRRPALFEREKSAVRGATRITAIVRAPRIGIIWQVVRAHRRRKVERTIAPRTVNRIANLRLRLRTLRAFALARSVLLNPELVHAGESIMILRFNLLPAIKIGERPAEAGELRTVTQK